MRQWGLVGRAGHYFFSCRIKKLQSSRGGPGSPNSPAKLPGQSSDWARRSRWGGPSFDAASRYFSGVSMAKHVEKNSRLGRATSLVGLVGLVGLRVQKLRHSLVTRPDSV